MPRPCPSRIGGQATAIDLESDEAIGVLLGDQQEVTVRGEGDLRRTDAGAAEAVDRAGQRAQATRAAAREAGDGVVAGVHDVDDAAMFGGADRLHAVSDDHRCTGVSGVRRQGVLQPARVPISFTVTLKALDRKPAGD